MGIPTDQVQLFITLADVALKSSRVSLALESYEAIVDVDENNVVAHRALARIHTEESRNSQAIKHWLVVKRLRPDINESLLRLARLFHRQNRFSKAIEAYESFQLIEPEHAEPSRVIPRLQLAMQEAADSSKNAGTEHRSAEVSVQAVAERASNDEPVDPEDVELKPLLYKAVAAMKAGQLNEAQVIYQRILALDETQVVAHRGLARIFSISDDNEQAIVHWQAVLRLRSDIKESHLRLGRLYRQQNRVAEAIAAYEAYQKLDPEHAEPGKVLTILRLASQHVSTGAWQSHAATTDEKEIPAPLHAADSGVAVNVQLAKVCVVGETPAVAEVQPVEQSVAAVEPVSIQHIAVFGDENSYIADFVRILERIQGALNLEQIDQDRVLDEKTKFVISENVIDAQHRLKHCVLKTDAIVLFRSPLQSWLDDDELDCCVEEFMRRWEIEHHQLAAMGAVQTDELFLDMDAFYADPEKHLRRLCALLGLRFGKELQSVERTTKSRKTVEQGIDGLQTRFEEDRSDTTYRNAMAYYRRDFSVVEPAYTRNITSLLTSIADEQVLVDSKRNNLYKAAEDAKRNLQIRLRTLEGSSVHALQASVTRKLIEQTDFGRYREMQLEYLQEESIKFHWDFVKYLNMDYWFHSKYQLAKKLGLTESDQLRILDLGVGPGHFPLVCTLLGHEVVGTDIDCSYTGNWGKPHIYDALIEFYKLDRRTHRIEPMETVPVFSGKFDLITAFMIKFNVFKIDGVMQVWGVREWEYFLRDVAINHLTENGRIFLKMNMTGQDTSSKYIDDSVLDLFTDHGATIDRTDSTVDFKSVKTLR